METKLVANTVEHTWMTEEQGQQLRRKSLVERRQREEWRIDVQEFIREVCGKEYMNPKDPDSRNPFAPSRLADPPKPFTGYGEDLKETSTDRLNRLFP